MNAQSYPVTVDYGQLVVEMIEAGRYDWVSSSITQEHFPQPQGEGTKEVDLVLIHLNRWANIKEVEGEIEKQGLRPGSIAELLAFGAKYPDIQRQFPIATISSVGVLLGGRRNVPCLSGLWEDGERHLSLHWYGGDWDSSWRFLAAPRA